MNGIATQAFNWVDYIFIAIFVFSMLVGFVRGFVNEIVALVTLVAAFIVATMFSNALAALFTSSPSVQNTVNSASSSIGMDTSTTVSYFAIAMAFVILFVGTIIVGKILGLVLNLAFQTGILGFGNRVLGGVFGLIRGFIINLVIIFVVQLTSFSQSASWQQSQIVAYYQPSVIWLGNVVSPSLANLKERFGQTVDSMGNKLQSISNQYTH